MSLNLCRQLNRSLTSATLISLCVPITTMQLSEKKGGAGPPGSGFSVGRVYPSEHVVPLRAQRRLIRVRYNVDTWNRPLAATEWITDKDVLRLGKDVEQLVAQQQRNVSWKPTQHPSLIDVQYSVRNKECDNLSFFLPSSLDCLSLMTYVQHFFNLRFFYS